MGDFQREIDTGRKIARLAGEAVLRHWRTGIAFDSKSDDSPVTAADRESEKLIAGMLEEAFPDDGILGEEGSDKKSRSGRRWIIDPIDGTRDFVRGNPVWSVLIGLESDGEVVAGFANLAALGDLFWAGRGTGAFVNDQPARVSPITSVSQAVLSINDLNAMDGTRVGSRLLPFMRPFWAVRSMGGCLDALMVARGQAELWVEPSGKPWDFAALKVIAEEAGARFFDFDGNVTIYGKGAVICVPALEQVARDLVRP
jgi:histidinol-phosphatase